MNDIIDIIIWLFVLGFFLFGIDQGIKSMVMDYYKKNK